MTTKDRERLAVLATECERQLADPTKQSLGIWRGDMRAIVAAQRELAGLFRPKVVPRALPLEDAKP